MATEEMQEGGKVEVMGAHGRPGGDQRRSGSYTSLNASRLSLAALNSRR